MADTATTPAPSPVWQLMLGLLPSLNTVLVALVTAGISIAGTWWAVKPSPPAPAAPVVVAEARPDPRIDDLTAKVDALTELMKPKAPRAKKAEAPR